MPSASRPAFASGEAGRAPATHRVAFAREGKSVEAADGSNLRLLAIEHGVDLYRGAAKLLNCRGRGRCKTCRVKVAPEGNLSPRTSAEMPRDLATVLQIIDHRELIGWRLACQSKVRGPVTVTTQA